MKLLIIRFSSIGDIVLTTPVLRCLKQQRPDIEIHFLTKASYRQIVEHNPYVDKFYYLNDDLPEIIEQLKAEQYHEIIDLHHNLRTLRIKRALQIPSFGFRKLNIQKWLLVNFKMHYMPSENIVARYMETVKHLNVVNDGKGLNYFIPEGMKLTTNDIPMSHWAGYVGAVIGGSYTTKKLPVEKWQELIELIPFPVILMGGPEDKIEGDEIAALDNIKIYNACGKFDLNESALLVKDAQVIATNDTGLMHIAAAFQKPIVSFWGNTSPEMGMFPYYGTNTLNATIKTLKMLENKELSCHPCSKIGYYKCPKGHFKCMKTLPMQAAADFIKQVWKQ